MLHVGRGPRHVVWLCWGVDHFAAVATGWLARSLQQGRSGAVAAAASELAAVRAVGSARQEGGEAWQELALDGMRWDLAQALSSTCPGGLWVVKMPLGALAGEQVPAGSSGLGGGGQNLGELEQALDAAARACGAVLVCVYDSGLLAAMPDSRASGVVEELGRWHSHAVVGGRLQRLHRLGLAPPPASGRAGAAGSTVGSGFTVRARRRSPSAGRRPRSSRPSAGR